MDHQAEKREAEAEAVSSDPSVQAAEKAKIAAEILNMERKHGARATVRTGTPTGPAASDDKDDDHAAHTSSCNDGRNAAGGGRTPPLPQPDASAAEEGTDFLDELD